MISFHNKKKVTVKSDNSILLIQPNQQQIQNIYQFCQNFHQHAADFMFLTIQIPKRITYSNLQLIDTEENLNMVLTILKQQRFILLQTVSQIVQSYKGFISWILIATQTKVYLIDSITLHSQCYRLKQILQDKKIVKFMNNYQKIIDEFKRDFSIFMANVFDIQIIRSYFCEKNKLIHRYNNLSQYVRNHAEQTSLRSISKMLQIQIQQFYENCFKSFFQIDKFFQQHDLQYRYYSFFNNYDITLKPYCHKILTQTQNFEILKLKTNFNLPNSYHQNQKKPTNKIPKFIEQKNKQQNQIIQKLLAWRQHYSKIKDINVQKLLPFIVIDQLVKKKVKSVLEISEVCSDFQMIHTIQIYQQILQLFQIQEDDKQNRQNQININQKKPIFIKKQEKSIHQLLKDVGWGSIDEWLNKKNDQSVKLYKQIISINQFDNSIVEQQIQKMEEKILKKHQILKFVKFAEYFRNENHRKLKDVYDSQARQVQQEEDHEWYDNYNELQQNKNYQGWDSIQKQINSKTMDTIKHANSSIALICSQDSLPVKSQNRLDFQSQKYLKQKCTNSLKYLESPSIKKIAPLPESIQNIYILAANVKKNYPKQQKKKKQGKSKTLIQEDFVPSKEDIFNLIYF